MRPLPPPTCAPQPILSAALRDCRRAFWSVGAFSAVVNVLMLAGPLYMLQIYDRVLSSRSVPTLVALSIFLVGAYGFQALFDLLRGRIVVRAAALLDQHLATAVHAAVVRLAIHGRDAGDAHQPIRDLDQIRAFLTSAGPIAIVDLPWVPVFLLICALIHPWLGLVSLVGSMVLLATTIATETASRGPTRVAAREAGLRAAMAEADRRNSESVVAMGMAAAMARRWADVNGRYLAAMGRSSDIVGSYASISKVIRLLLQSMILGLGAYLVIRQELTAGAMIAASIMMGRALAPIETAIANWRPFIAARQSFRRLSETLKQVEPYQAEIVLPKPACVLEVDRVTVAPPGLNVPLVADVQFRLAAGEVLGIIGPNGAGKTSLARTLVGVWPPARGVLRLDGGALDQWGPELLGRHIGFLSQDAELFDGRVGENIARMEEAPDSGAVLRAAQAAGAHDMILRLVSGYETRIGQGGIALSAGQRQRIALARAFYRDPFLIVLDEPHANLDNEGETALHQAITAAKNRGAIVILIAHRPSALAVCDKVLVLANGLQQAFGPRDEVMQKVLARPAHPAAAVGANLKVVGESGGGER
jgi:ATP-binding cassette subfamily C protein